MIRIRKKRLFGWLTIILGTFALIWLLFRIITRKDAPPLDPAYALQFSRKKVGDSHYSCGDSWLKKNEHGLWEMYLKGSDYELGILHGLLAAEQVETQEEVFISQIRQMIPSGAYLRFLKFLIVWMNRNIDSHIPPEYLNEIYGVSLNASDEYKFIGPAYLRFLNYHSAHDIGHALQNMNLVACTAFGVKAGRSANGVLMVGRNFDFSMGDDFAREKILAFYEPDQGYKFASITWGGMIGVTSGMNEKGLAITLNSAKSGIPKKSKTPVSILARNILQHASNIEEAYSLACEAQTFVSESFLVSSARDGKSVVIEKTQDKTAIFDPGGDEIILTNHFQSEAFSNRPMTLENIREGSSLYRMDRTRELLARKEKHDVQSFAEILRDQKGQRDKNIGMGNEMSVNQLVAHHSVIFKPEERQMWVSAYPYALGTYMCFDLREVFDKNSMGLGPSFNDSLSLDPDPFLSSKEFENFMTFKKETERLKHLLNKREVHQIREEEIQVYLDLNPAYYYSHYIAGEYYRLTGNKDRAKELYEKSLEMDIPRKVDAKQVEDALLSLKKK